MNINIYKVIGYIAVLLFAFQFVFADVIVFNNYETTTTLQDGHLQIEREITLLNVGSDPIIPGELHFRIHELKNGEYVGSQIRNVQAHDDYGEEIDSRLVEGEEETQLVLSHWEPIIPQFNYNIHLNYEIVFEAGGFLFSELIVPVEETTIPIRNSENKIHIPERYSVTYAPDADVRIIEKENGKYTEVSWDGLEQMPVEYTVLPLPRLGVKAVNLFWGVIIVVTLISSYILHRKLR